MQHPQNPIGIDLKSAAPNTIPGVTLLIAQLINGQKQLMEIIEESADRLCGSLPKNADAGLIGSNLVPVPRSAMEEIYDGLQELANLEEAAKRSAMRLRNAIIG